MKPLDWETDQKFLDSELKSLKCVTLYLLSTGRNAWHSTWSTRYQKSAALFSTFEAARNTAETARNRGTTFKITQYPGLAFFSLEGVVALVEFHSNPTFGKLKQEFIYEYLSIGTPIRDAIAPFVKVDKQFWNPPFPSQDSFVNLKSDLAENLEPNLQPSYLKSWNSVASGSNYYLGWHETTKPTTTPIEKIMKEYEEANIFVDLEKNEKELEDAILLATEKRAHVDAKAKQFSEASAWLEAFLEEQ